MIFSMLFIQPIVNLYIRLLAFIHFNVESMAINSYSLLRHDLDINWKQHITSENLHGDLPKISSVIQQRRLRLVGHCYGSDKTVANVILWKPKHGYRRSGRPKLDYVTLLTQDTCLTNEELCTAMLGRELWSNYVDLGAPD